MAITTTGGFFKPEDEECWIPFTKVEMLVPDEDQTTVHACGALWQIDAPVVEVVHLMQNWIYS